MFLDDDETQGIIMIGEIGGSAEEEAAQFLIDHKIKKPVTGFIAGVTGTAGSGAWAMPAPSSRVARATAGDKIEAMKRAGIHVADSPAALGFDHARRDEGLRSRSRPSRHASLGRGVGRAGSASFGNTRN